RDLPSFPTRRASDLNHDDVVDAADFLAVETNFGRTGVADGTLPGDANGDGRVDAADYLAIEQNFGLTLADLQASPTVPEPGLAALLAALAPAALLRRRRSVSV